VTLAASAITAVYIAGYVHTESADSLLAASSSPDTTGASSPTASLPTVSLPPTPVPAAASAVTPTEAGITDQAVELYADQHQVSWDTARAQMEATAGLPASAPTDASTAGTKTSSAVASRPTIGPTLPSRTSTLTVRTSTAVSAAPATSTGGADLKDGTFSGVGTSRRGNVQVSLLIESGHIATVNITGATTEYPTRDIASLPAEVVSRQSAQIDTVSGATYSSQAFRSAVLQALQRAEA